MTHKNLSIGFAVCFVLIGGSFAHAQQWTRFRGPNGTGHSKATDIPVKWTMDDFKWRVKLPGIGHSSPVLWGDKIFLTSANPSDGTRSILCRSAADGSELWTKKIPSTTHHLHRQNSFASSTPAVDADRVYVIVTTPRKNRVIALDHAGKEVWQFDLGPFLSRHGPAVSPMLFDSMVIVSNLQQGVKLKPGQKTGKSEILALDTKTGKPRWTLNRKSGHVSYSTPCIYQGKNGPELITISNGDGVTSINPKDGSVNWELGGVFNVRTVGSPLFASGLFFGTCGSGGGGNYLIAVRPGTGAAKPKIVYKVTKVAPYVPTSLIKGDLMFLWYDKGVVTCIDVATGKVHWRERVPGYYSSSPVLVGDRLYCSDYKSGKMVVLSATDKFKLLARNPLGEPTRATPAIVGETMYLRTESHLMAIGGKRKIALNKSTSK